MCFGFERVLLVYFLKEELLAICFRRVIFAAWSGNWKHLIANRSRLMWHEIFNQYEFMVVPFFARIFSLSKSIQRLFLAATTWLQTNENIRKPTFHWTSQDLLGKIVNIGIHIFIVSENWFYSKRMYHSTDANMNIEHVCSAPYLRFANVKLIKFRYHGIWFSVG